MIGDRGAGLVAALGLVCAPLRGQLPRTVPERTNYQRTSSTAEVGAFLDSLQRSGAPLVVSEMGKSAGGRPNYLVIVSDPAVTSPGEAVAAGKLVVYLQANIHGGEVEGKEAVQALLRELAGPRHVLLDKLVILVAPVYNADGNDAFGPQAQNRSEQNGPDPVGQRYEGLNLDLNRDYFKVEAPETRASLERVYDRWDPAVMMDLHTTDGTLHGFLLTYAPPLDPNGPAGPTAWVRDQLLPAVRKTLQDKYKESIFDYGDTDDPLKPTRWETYAPLGWYGTNYVGLRGRMAILSEAYSHAAFEKRIRVTHDFVAEILDYVAAHTDDVRRIERDADRQTTLEGAGSMLRPELAVAYEMASRGTEPVPLVVMRANPDTTARRRALPTDTVRVTSLPIFDRFRATKTRTLPAGYYLPPGERAVADLLRLHGLLVERLEVEWSDSVQVFGVKEEKWADRPFQGHKLLALTGDYGPTIVRTLPAGTYFVPTAQALGRLAFSLLEPEGWGLPRWNVFDRLLGADFGAYAGLVYGSTAVAEFPVWRAVRAPRAPRTALP